MATNNWQLLRVEPKDLTGDVEKLEELKHGTMVVWERLDRLVGDVSSDNTRARQQFLASIRSVEEHVAMVFHRFLTRAEINLHLDQRSECQPLGPLPPGQTRNPVATLGKPGFAAGADYCYAICTTASLAPHRRGTQGSRWSKWLECPTGILRLPKCPTDPSGRLARVGIPQGGALQAGKNSG